MTNGELILVNIICPYCKFTFKKEIEYEKKAGLFALLIKNHPESNGCAPFVAYIDNTGRHRGSQKVDDVDADISNYDQFLDNARDSITELKEKLRFYHLKMPRVSGRGFEYRVANVSDRSFMSSVNYSKLIEYLSENKDENTFGAISIDNDSNFEGGVLTYGKYLGLVFTLFWKDQKTLLNETFDEIKGQSNLMVEKLLDLYELTDLFF